jgi:glycosyltransferase involved in cell wall biosynthesis
VSNRVLLATPFFYPGIGGTEAYVAALARDLTDLGYAVSVAAPGDEASQSSYDGIPVYRYLEPRDVERAVIVGDEPSPGVAAFAELVRWLQPDLVHAHALSRGLSLHHLTAAKACDVPVLVTLHLPNLTCERGTMMRWGRIPCDGRMEAVRCTACRWEEKGVPALLAAPAARLAHIGARAIPAVERLLPPLGHPRAVERRLARTRDAMAWLDAVVIVSEWMRSPLEANGLPTDRVHLSRQGLVGASPEPRARSIGPGDPLRLGYLGRVTPVKGVHLLAQAVAQLPSSLDVELVIVGPCSADGDEAYLAEILRTSPRVHYRGVAAPADVNEILAGVDAICIPSLWLETGPLVVLEAFAAGLPVIGAALGGIAERVVHGESGLLVEDPTPTAWAEAISELARLTRAGHRWQIPPVRTSAQVAEETDRLYRSVLRDFAAKEPADPPPAG